MINDNESETENEKWITHGQGQEMDLGQDMDTNILNTKCVSA